MKKILFYENRKTDPIIWDISTSELENIAFMELFRILDEDWQVYSDLRDLKAPEKPSLSSEQISKLPEGQVKKTALQEHKNYEFRLREYKMQENEKQLYEKSKQGDNISAKKLLRNRRDYEYEQWKILDVR